MSDTTDTPISALDPATLPLSGTEQLPLVQGTNTVRAAASAVAALAAATPGGAPFTTQINQAGAFGGVGPGTVGQVLVSNGPSAAPSFQNQGSGAAFDLLYPQVSLLLHFDGANGSTVVTDSGPVGNVVTAAGGAVLSTTNPKFGTACASFTGTGCYIFCPVTALGPLDIWAGDLTIEFWVRPLGSGESTQILFDLTNQLSTGGRIYLLNAGAGGIAFEGFGSVGTVTTSTPVTSGVWSHVALVRYGPALGLFVNGIPTWGTAFQSNAGGSPGDVLYLGASYNSFGQGTWFSGALDELRITFGNARYVNRFTPPTLPFPSQG
jgi:hypothetical protein